MWHVSSRSGVATCEQLYICYLLTYSVSALISAFKSTCTSLVCTAYVYECCVVCRCSCEREGSIGLFLTAFVPFCRCLAERKSTYKRLEGRFNGSVQMTSADTLCIQPPHRWVEPAFLTHTVHKPGEKYLTVLKFWRETVWEPSITVSLAVWLTYHNHWKILWKSQSEWQRTGINGESMSMVRPTLGSRMAKNRTELLESGLQTNSCDEVTSLHICAIVWSYWLWNFTVSL